VTRLLRNSGVAWLGALPADWTVTPLGVHFAERKEQVSDAEFPPLSVTKGGVVPQLETAAKTDNNDSRKLIRRGDFVINARSDRKGSSGVSDLEGSTSVVYTVLEPRSTVDRRYVHHLLRSEAFQEEFYRWGNGIVADLWSTRYSSMRRIPFPVPPLAEQRAIADFLDQQTSRIDTLIGKQTQLIDTLRERRRVVSERLVVRATPITSGQRLKHVTLNVRQGWSPQCLSWPAKGSEAWGVLKAGAANAGRFRPGENKELPPELTPRPETVVRRGDLVVSRANTRDLVGSAAVVLEDYPRLMLCDKLYAFNLDRSRAVPEFVSARMATRALRGLIEVAAGGTSPSMQNISREDLGNLPMDLPSVPDQRDILAELDRQTSQIDALIAKAEEFIGLARERRAALITAAVTGQIDVRTAGRAATVGA
jgi:type I restriction enzyme S subunit